METEAEKSKTCPCKCGKHGAVILILLIAGVICWHIHRPHHRPPHPPVGPMVGAECVVQLREDVAGKDCVLRGRLMESDPHAILLENGGDGVGYWIPSHHVLFITYKKPPHQNVWMKPPKEAMPNTPLTPPEPE
jgi:hypothetical protein